MTADDFDRQMQVISDHAGAAFLQVKLSHIRHLKGDGSAAIGLAFFLNLLRMKSSNKKDRQRLMKDDLWFKCPAWSMQNQLGMTKRKRPRVIQTLLRCNLIETDYRLGNYLWIRINTEELNKIPTDNIIETRPSGNPQRGLPNRKPPKGTSGNPQRGLPKPPKGVSHRLITLLRNLTLPLKNVRKRTKPSFGKVLTSKRRRRVKDVVPKI